MIHKENCTEMFEGEVLNQSHDTYPLYNVIFYANKHDSAKFSKRLSCSIKHLALRLEIHFEHDVQKAVDHNIKVDPTFVLEGTVFLQGLVQAEEIQEKFHQFLLTKNKEVQSCGTKLVVTL